MRCSHPSSPSLLLVCSMATAFRVLVLYWAFRLSCSASSPEWFQNISTSLFDLSGDIMLGGLFPINQLTSNLSQRSEPNNISCERYRKNSCFPFVGNNNLLADEIMHQYVCLT